MKTDMPYQQLGVSLVLSISLATVCIFAGCDRVDEVGPAASGLASRQPAELATMFSDELAEFKFLISEEAGADSLSESAARLDEIAEALTTTAAANENGESKLIKAVYGLKHSCDELSSSVQSGASAAALSKAASKISKDRRFISKMIE